MLDFSGLRSCKDFVFLAIEKFYKSISGPPGPNVSCKFYSPRVGTNFLVFSGNSCEKMAKISKFLVKRAFSDIFAALSSCCCLRYFAFLLLITSFLAAAGLSNVMSVEDRI
jgi:hypothetical protein